MYLYLLGVDGVLELGDLGLERSDLLGLHRVGQEVDVRHVVLRRHLLQRVSVMHIICVASYCSQGEAQLGQQQQVNKNSKHAQYASLTCNSSHASMHDVVMLLYSHPHGRVLCARVT